MILYSPTISARLAYMAGWLGRYLFGKPLVLNDTFPDGNEPVIFYSAEITSIPCLQIVPYGLLNETIIRPLNVGILPKQDEVWLCDSDGRELDLLSAIFYLLSRYEEYLPHQKDEYGRYAHFNSILFRGGLLLRPVVDEWMEKLRQSLAAKFPELVFVKRSFRFIPTYDVDIAWSYRHKGFLRNAGGLFKNIARLELSVAAERVQVITSGKQDPFDVFTELDELHKSLALEPHYFILLAKELKGYDRNIGPYNSGYRKLVKQISSRYATGIHLSWQAATSEPICREEKQMLEDITGQPVESNRMHYINFHLPDTFRRLNRIGIREDYSMGYGSINGFRAGTCTPFSWYDLKTEKETTLLLFPFCYMEANSIFEQKDNPEKAAVELQQVHDITRRHNGTLVTIFHNHLVGMSNKGRAWMQVYRQFLQQNFGR